MIRRRSGFAAQDHGNHRLGLGQHQLALLVAILIAPFQAGLIGFAGLKSLREPGRRWRFRRGLERFHKSDFFDGKAFAADSAGRHPHADQDEDEGFNMALLKPSQTGIDNSVFVSRPSSSMNFFINESIAS
jgi:hypothetical protein